MTKLYYSIKEISDLVDEEQHILRYWEKEFIILKPKKNKAGNRTYTYKDLQIILKIKSMIREEHLSLKEAKEKCKSIKISELLEDSEEKTIIEVAKGLDQKYNLDSEPVIENQIDRLKSEIGNDIGDDIGNNIESELLIKEDSINEFKNNSNQISEEANVETIVELNKDDKQEKIKEQSNEDIIDFNFDKKIILKNHLFEDFEEFSVFDADKFNEIKNSKIVKEEQNKNVDYVDESNENIAKNNNNVDGIVLSYDSIKSLIFILKEIKQLINN